MKDKKNISFKYNNEIISFAGKSDKNIFIQIHVWLYNNNHTWCNFTNNGGNFYTEEQKNEQIKRTKSGSESNFYKIYDNKYILTKLSSDAIKKLVCKNLSKIEATDIVYDDSNININKKNKKDKKDKKDKPLSFLSSYSKSYSSLLKNREYNNINVTNDDIKKILICEENILYLKPNDKDEYNVSKLLGINISQSQSIRFGNFYQKFIIELVSLLGAEIVPCDYIDVYNTGSKTSKGKKDIDILFKYDNKLYYFECKVNTNLDSEKGKETNKKVNDITDYLTKNNDIHVISGILSAWYTKELNLRVNVNNILFFEDLLKIFNYDGITSDEYYSMMKELGKEIEKEY